MGFSEAEASIAMERCGPDSSIAKLTNFICAAQMAKVTDTFLPITQRTLPEDAMSTFLFKINDWFYQTRSDNSKNTSRRCYEHMAFVPVNVWTGISQYLFDVEPEFVDSKHFHATTLKRAIFIILPIKNRFSLILLPPCADAFPLTKKMMAFLGSKNKVELFINMYRKCQIDRMDLNKVAPLEPDEAEMLLGFLKNHTRGGGSARDMFPSDINVLFLFAGISAAEVAFYCLSISLKTDVQELNDDRLEQLMSRFGGFDLVVGSIPCNNLDGSNKHHHDELEDFCWCIFLQ
ncbi:hypothetical protein F3Y22_tig00110234pilonHSYRG00049 [Hibiscus syriacus]|uniref:SAM-dependent MTase DRM-type domain-containing protein n=1 Tax=Hibiscus syriacus TaxID=106335 RepID=A0A6A3B6U8_HIBSY|nr:hypothetical protein F3Y22_tig00110234pilonHSYRG00049 [Hibiscus syriacus]